MVVPCTVLIRQSIIQELSSEFVMSICVLESFCSQHFLTLSGLEVNSVRTLQLIKWTLKYIYFKVISTSQYGLVLKQNKVVYVSKFLVAVSKSGNNSHCYACYFLAFRDLGLCILFKLCDCFWLVQLNVYVSFFFVVTDFIFIVAFLLLCYFLVCTFVENTTKVVPYLGN